MDRVEEWHIKERKNSRKGLVTSLVVHGLLLLLLVLLTTSLKQPDDQIQGVLIDFGSSTTGQGTNALPKNEDLVEEVSPSQPAPAPAQTADVQPTTPDIADEVVTQDFEEAPTIEPDKPTEEEIAAQQAAEQAAAEQAAQEAAEAAAAEAAAQAAAEAAAQAAAEQEFLNELEGEWSNSGGGDGSQGESDPGGDFGSPDGVNNGGDGSGLGTDGIGHDLGGRVMVKKPSITDSSQKTGKVAVKVRVDRNGNVIFAKYTTKGSNTTDSYLIRLAEQAAKKAKFNSDFNAASEQVGTIYFTFKVQ
ncbi:MAG: hypothetical protein GY751_02335 [Bacteroidetes bacterium]|nr:hypothetical protein [Bacteroidota bacterium]